jgi:hypothetical protein
VPGFESRQGYHLPPSPALGRYLLHALSPFFFSRTSHPEYPGLTTNLTTAGSKVDLLQASFTRQSTFPFALFMPSPSCSVATDGVHYSTLYTHKIEHKSAYSAQK